MRVSCIQIAAAGDREQRIAGAEAQCRAAAGSDLIVLPELWATGFFAFGRYAAEAEPIDGPLVTRMRALARELGCVLHMGSFVERAGDGLFNCSVLIDADGHILARYRKVHLFGYDSAERRLLRPGGEAVVADCPWGRVGLATCYDLRFPELFRLMVDQGAAMFVVTSAWPSARLSAWRLFTAARAHENLAALVACNAAGDVGSADTPCAGHSVIVDPWAAVLAEGGDGPGVISAELDPAGAQAARERFPALDDRVFHAQRQEHPC